MRIVHITTYHLPELGYEVAYLSKMQARAGHKVYIISSNIAPPEKPSAHNTTVQQPDKGGNDTKVIRLPVLKVKNRIIYLLGLSKALRQIKPDVTHCHDIFSLNAIVAALLKRRSANNILVFCNHAADFNTNARSNFFRRLVYSMFRISAGWLIKKHADALVAISENEQLFLSRELGVPQEQVRISRLPVPVELFNRSQTTRGKVRQELEITETDVVIIHAGTLAPRKRVDLLIQALRAVRRTNANVKLLLVGGGEGGYLQSLRTLVRIHNLGEHVCFIDRFVSKQELASYFTAADIAVWPGDISIAAVEAMATGLPVIFRRDEYTRFLTSNHNGILIETGNPEGLTVAIAKLAEDASLREVMGVRSKELAEKYFSLETVTKTVEEIYEQCGCCVKYN